MKKICLTFGVTSVNFERKESVNLSFGVCLCKLRPPRDEEVERIPTKINFQNCTLKLKNLKIHRSLNFQSQHFHLTKHLDKIFYKRMKIMNTFMKVFDVMVA